MSAKMSTNRMGMREWMLALASGFAWLIGVTGCTVGPKYHTPAPPQITAPNYKESPVNFQDQDVGARKEGQRMARGRSHCSPHLKHSYPNVSYTGLHQNCGKSPILASAKATSSKRHRKLLTA